MILLIQQVVRFQGSFVKGKRQGRGTIKFASGDSASGKWNDGALVETGAD